MDNDNQMPPDPVAEELSSEPVEYQFRDEDGRWRPFINEKHRRNTEAAGYRTRALYTHPQPAIDVDALAEHIRKINRPFLLGAAAMAENICNWIEEQNR